MRVVGYHHGAPLDLEIELVDDNDHYLRPDAAAAFRAMRSAAADAGHVLRINTAWRSNDYQRQLWEAYREALRVGKRHSIVAEPGWSNHQSGIAIDVETGGVGTEIDKWLKLYAMCFGFWHTVSSENWHLEYKVVSAPGLAV